MLLSTSSVSPELLQRLLRASGSARASSSRRLLTAAAPKGMLRFALRPQTLSRAMSSATGAAPALFQPIKVGEVTLAHRVALAPLTRVRADAAHVHTDLGVEYYAQRASVPGTLLITEATYISGQASGQPHAPGIWNDAQVEAWKKVSKPRDSATTVLIILSFTRALRSSTRFTRRGPTSSCSCGRSGAPRAPSCCTTSFLTTPMSRPLPSH